MGNDVGNASDNILEQNCRADWPVWTCIFANVCGLCSTTLWFLVLLPQVWKNFHRKSVKGLSVLWATANFTASLINLFFVFLYASIPLYSQISSIYCPILEFTLLIQFWIYGRYMKWQRIAYVVTCVLLWTIVISVELIFSLEDLVEYVAIILWCIETFPQVILNMKLKSTNGQATVSVLIATLGKTTDFFANNFLVMPLQYVIMVYFSSSVAFVNGFQVAWYYGRDDSSQTGRHMTGRENDVPRQLSEDNPNFDSQFAFNNDSLGYSTPYQAAPDNSIDLDMRNTKCVNAGKLCSMVVLSALLIMCVVGFVWNINSFFGLFAPCAILLILGLSKLYFMKFHQSDYSLN